LSVVKENFLAIGFRLSVSFVQNGVKDLLSSLLTVVDSKADFHVFVRLEVTMGQLLEEVKDDIGVLIFILVHETLHLHLSLLASFDKLKKLIELNVHVIIDCRYHFFDLLARIDQTQSNQGVLQLIDANCLRAIFIQVIEAIVEDRHLLLIKINVL
jgi:exonuclease V gamma subunit